MIFLIIHNAIELRMNECFLCFINSKHSVFIHDIGLMGKDMGLAYKKPAEVYFNTSYKNADADAFKEKLLSGLKPNENICLKPIIDELNLQ